MTAPCFIFLQQPTHVWAYVRQVAKAVKAGGHVIVSTFLPEGPTKCSGLDVVRYNAESLHEEFGVPGGDFSVGVAVFRRTTHSRDF